MAHFPAAAIDAVTALASSGIGDFLATAADRDRGIPRDDFVTSEVEIMPQPRGHA